MISRDLLLVLALKDIKVRYRNTLFGLLWAAAAPIVYAGIYGAAFGLLGVKRPVAGWAGFLVGVAAWQWTAGTISAAPTLYLRNLSLLQRMPPRWGYHAAATVLCESAILLAILPVAAALSLTEGAPASFSALVSFPLLAVAQTAALTGWASAAATTNLVLRDVERLTPPLITLLFFFTPVAFSSEHFPPAYRTWLLLNPAAVFVEGWRAAFVGTLSGPLIAAALLHAALGLLLTAVLKRFFWPRLAEFA